MIELTKYAALKVIEIAEEEKSEPMIRAKVMGGGCAGFTYDLSFISEFLETDELFECHGVKVYVDPVSFQYLDGMTIDYEDHKLGQAGFKFNNPNSKGSCGCGNSFNA
jgi:iron-sulfur cluster insertion protein